MLARPPAGAILLVVREQVVQSTYSAPEDRHRRRATEAELRAWGAFLRAGTASAAALEAALDGTGVAHSEYDVLLNVATGPKDGLRPTELAQRVVITKSGLTRLVDRLVERGYLERRACESDRRVTYAVLTDAGRRKLEPRDAPHHRVRR